MSNYKIGLWGNLEDAWIALMWRMFFTCIQGERVPTPFCTRNVTWRFWFLSFQFLHV